MRAAPIPLDETVDNTPTQRQGAGGLVGALNRQGEASARGRIIASRCRATSQAASPTVAQLGMREEDINTPWLDHGTRGEGTKSPTQLTRM